MLIRWVLSVVVNAVVLLAVSQLFDSFYLADFQTALIASIILSVLNVLVKPLLILFTLPITILTLGFFLFVVNAATLMIAQAMIGSSFEIHTWGTAILASIVISFLNVFLTGAVRTATQDR